MSTKTKDLIKQLDEGIKAVYETETWKQYLAFCARFPNYSVNNRLLIFAQRPDATMIQSLTGWNRMNGRVKKGSKAISIICPHVTEQEQPDGSTKKILGFHKASVFDIADVDVDLPDSPCRILDGEIKDFGLLVDALCKIAPCPVEFGKIKGKANGYFSPDELKIVVKDSLPEAHKIRCLIHEIAHSYLHAHAAECEDADRNTREFQAESVSYLVSKGYLGMDDVGDYSFPYIASWSEGKSTEMLKENIEVILRTSDKIIAMLEDLQGKEGAA
ncbi:MAG: ssDNA-binding domain-containing protein [Clostridiales bacterium]|nr:ssDNA-binding domain-containing protein [Clostridiales bacterium]